MSYYENFNCIFNLLFNMIIIYLHFLIPAADGQEQGRTCEEIVRDFLLEIHRHADGSFVPYAEDEMVIILYV